MRRAAEAIVSVIDDHVRARLIIPEGSTAPLPGAAVRVPALVAAKVALHNEMRRRGLRKSAMRERLKWHRPQIDRLLDVRYASKMDQVEKAFDALGLELVVAARPSVAGVRARHLSAGYFAGVARYCASVTGSSHFTSPS